MTSRRLDIQAPLIVIGAGRSGTTLLMRALRAHPQISFHGENDFLAPRLWRETMENRFWDNWERQFRLNPSSAMVPLPRLDDQAQARLNARAGALIAQHVCGLVEVRRTAAVWGYKELWNGASWIDQDWSVYDHIYPRAVWLHLVRNPFTFSASAARWNVKALTREHLRELLAVWTNVQGKSRERWTTGRYIRLRYEDMIADPLASLSPTLESLGLDWDSACGEVFSASHFKSAASKFPKVESCSVSASDYARVVPRLIGQCEDLGYLDACRIDIEEEDEGSTGPVTDLRAP